MGMEMATTVAVNGRRHACNVHLEPNEIVSRGELRRTFAHAAMGGAAVDGTQLVFTHDGDRIGIDRGKAAAKWLDRIRNPRARTQKLGVAPGMQVCVLGRAEPDAVREIAAASGSAPKTRLTANAELVLCFCAEPRDLARLATIAPKLAAGGAVWVLWPKGRKDFAHEHVVAAAREVRLSTTRSMGFSEQLTGLRLVRSKQK